MNIDKFEDLKELISSVFETEKGQCLIVGLDSALLSYAKNIIYKPGYESIDVTTQKDESPENKIFFINLNETNSMIYQSLIYYYLELPSSYNCFVCLISNNCRCLDFFEKRVRSRFKNKIIFIPYLDVNEPIDPYLFYIGTEKYNVQLFLGEKSQSKCKIKDVTNSSIEQRFIQSLMNKYNLESYSLEFHMDLFNPIHFALIILSRKRKLKYKNCISLFREFIIPYNELKAISNNDIYFSFCDLLSSGFINSYGELIVDFSEIKDYISLKCPQYLKSMLIKNNK